MYAVEAHDEAAEKATDAFLLDAGEKAPRTWEQLWTCMAVLDALSTCWWGCARGDHVVERLVGRVFGSVRAAIRLSRGGLYDEALNALRTAGEVVNLLTLMQHDPELLGKWREAQPQERFAMARPTRVIKALEGLGRGESSLNAQKYDLLSRIAHGNTDTPPQTYNALGVPLVAGHFQHAGFLVVMNEAAILTALALVPGAELIELDPEVRRGILEKGRNLVESTGGVMLDNVRMALEAQRMDAWEAYESQLSGDGPTVRPPA